MGGHGVRPRFEIALVLQEHLAERAREHWAKERLQQAVDSSRRPDRGSHVRRAGADRFEVEADRRHAEGPGGDQVRLMVENAERTRSRILDAAVALVTEQNDAAFSVPDVATRAGVALRTVYRYFPTRQHLIDGVAAVGDHVAETDLPTARFELTDLAPWLEQAWSNLMAREAFIRAQHGSPNGAAIRRARIGFFRDVTRTLLLREIPDINPADVDDTVDTILLLVSSSSMFELLDVLEVPTDRGARLVSNAVVAVIDTHRRPRPGR